MKIGIISDTHIERDKDKLLALLNDHLKDVELIIHGGDYKNKEVIDIIKKHKRFIGVYGNVDNGIKNILEKKKIIEIEGYRIGIFHGHGDKNTTIKRSYDEFKNENLDIIIFGHSHQPVIKTKNKVLMLNPGSPTNKRRERWFSYILLELSLNSINASLRLFST